MSWWSAVWTRINRTKTTTSRTRDGSVVINNDRSFKGLPMSTQTEINDIIENECRIRFKQINRVVDSLDDVKARSADLGLIINTSLKEGTSVVNRVADAIGFRDFATGNPGGRMGGISNNMWNTGVAGQDPAKAGRVSPNLYITPGEAATVYSQKGIPEVIIGKKAKSMLLNGVHIKNPFYSADQLETIARDMIRTGLAKAISDSLRESLVFSGSLLFPFFKGDTPVAMTLPVEQLARYGLIKKDCIDRWVTLDRWNTVHFPNWNPTSEDFRKPRYFYIPFLGTDVHSSRIARVVTAPQPGYWGVLLNMGWGVSDIPGWIEAVFNYYNVMQSIPTMINQMSLLARTFNVDGPMAMEGSMILDQMGEEDTIRVREASPLNPVNLDVIGDLKAIQRDFGEVSELTRLVRQDLAAKAGLLEEAIFTVEKKGIGGGKSSKDPWTRQEETNRLMYAEVQAQLKPIAMLQVINALGMDKHVLDHIEYTQISFDEQKITDIEDKVAVLAAASKGFFDMVAGGMPMPDSADMLQQISGGLVHIDAELRAKLEERQAILDAREQEAHEAEMAGLEVDSSSASSTKEKQGHSYDDPLKQKSMEKVSHKGPGTKKQGISKARSKRVGL